MTTATLRPDGTVSTSGTTTVTGAGGVRHTATNDNSDATYVNVAGSSSNQMRLSFGTTTLNAGAIVKTVTPRFRHRGSGGVSGDIGGIGLFTGGTLLSSSSGPFASAFTTTTGTAVAPTSFPQASVDAIEMTFVGLSSLYFGADIAEVYVDVVSAEIPTTTATGPTGALASSSGTAAWTYAQGSDGSAQERYRVKIYTAAEYGGGGFSPDTTPVTVYDSGDVTSAAVSHAISGLVNGTTYRAYIRTAQVTNGNVQWSAWSFSGFTTSFTTAVVSSVVATASNTLAKHAVVVSRNVGNDAWNAVEVQRSDNGGTSWIAVRDATLATASGNLFSIDDYESSNGTSTLYRARARSSVTGAIGAWVQSTPANAWTSTSTWLKDPNSSTLNKTVRARYLPSPSRGRQQNVFYPIGRSDPIVVSDVLRLRAGTIVFTTTTSAEITELLALMASQVLLLQTPTTHLVGSMYVVFVGDLVEERATRVAVHAPRYFSAGFVEVLTPVDT